MVGIKLRNVKKPNQKQEKLEFKSNNTIAESISEIYLYTYF